MSRKRSSLTGGTGDYNPQTITRQIEVEAIISGNTANFGFPTDDPVTGNQSYQIQELYFPGTIEINTGSTTTVVEILEANYTFIPPWKVVTNSRENAYWGIAYALTDGGQQRARNVTDGQQVATNISKWDYSSMIDYKLGQGSVSYDAAAGAYPSGSSSSTRNWRTDFRDGNGRGVVVYNNRISITTYIFQGFSKSEAQTHGGLASGITIVKLMYRFKRVPVNDLLTKRAAIDFVS